MKLERKPISEFPHMWRYSDPANPVPEYVTIDRHNSNFHESDGWYNDSAKIVYTKTGAQFRYNNIIWILWTDETEGN